MLKKEHLDFVHQTLDLPSAQIFPFWSLSKMKKNKHRDKTSSGELNSFL